MLRERLKMATQEVFDPRGASSQRIAQTLSQERIGIEVRREVSANGDRASKR